MPHASSDVSSNDEVKVYRVEGEGDDESSAENLKEEKRSLLTEVALKEESGSVEPSDRPNPEPPHHSHPHHQQTHVGALSGGKHFEYFPSPPFGYVHGYHPHARGPYGALPMVGRVPLVPSNHPPSPLSLMMYSAEQFQPPPAHMGIHIDPKTGMPRPSVFPLPPSQFHPPHVFPPDYSQQYSWHHSPVYPVTPGFRSPPYPIALSPLIHPLMQPVPKQERTNDSQDGRSMCNFSPSSPFSPVSNGSMHQNHQRRAPRMSISSEQRAKKKASHIKKPLNAFMLYMKEQRPQVVAECTLKESAAINQILGKKWHALSRDEQSKYYEMARSERQMHMQRYPGWTARDNYAINAKKKKRKRDKSQDGDGNNPKKCRARFGLDKQSSWCKPCRRKKKCIRYRSGSDNTAGESEDNIGSVGSAQTPDSRYGADEEEEEEEELSDTDSGNEEDASSEFSLSSPPLSSIPIGGPLATAPSLQPPPSHQSSHPLNVQSLSQPHTPKAPNSPPVELIPMSRASPIATLEQNSLSRGSHSPPSVQNKIESQSHLPQKASESHLMQNTTKSHLVQFKPGSQLLKNDESPQNILESHLQRLSQMADPHFLSRQVMDSQHYTKDPHLQRQHLSVEPRRPHPHHTKDPQLSRPHLSPEPRLSHPHHSKDHQLPHLKAETLLQHSHHSKDSRLPYLMAESRLPHHSRDSELLRLHQVTDSHLPQSHQITEPHPHHTKLPRSHQTTDPNESRLHQTTDPQLSRLHQTKDSQQSQLHNSKDPQLSRSHSTKDPQHYQMTDTKLPVSLLTKDLQRLHQTLDSNLQRSLPMADIQSALPHSSKDPQLQLSYPTTELRHIRTSVEAHQATQPLQST